MMLTKRNNKYHVYGNGNCLPSFSRVFVVFLVCRFDTVKVGSFYIAMKVIVTLHLILISLITFSYET